MSDEPHEPPEPEVQPSSIFEVAPESHSTSVGRPGDGLRHFPTPSAPRPPRYRLALVLFLATCASTFYAGTFQFLEPMTVIDPATGKKQVQIRIDSATRREMALINWRQSLLNGLTYATAVLVMLGAHEMGHYVQARRYGVPASLPLFIPMPFGPLGTMGAVIVQKAGTADRKSMFDIAISGPLAGLVVALPLNWWGIQHSQVMQIPPNEVGWTNPLIVEWMIGWIHKPLLAGEDIILNPILFAGWVGIFITGLNLIPIGQLDGGHILYCLLGRKAHRIARALYVGAIAFVVLQVVQGHNEYSAWTLMLILVGFMGTRHPPTADDGVPLGKPRMILGWLTLAFIFVGFVPSPMYESKGPSEPTVPIQQSPKIARLVAERIPALSRSLLASSRPAPSAASSRSSRRDTRPGTMPERPTSRKTCASALPGNCHAASDQIAVRRRSHVFPVCNVRVDRRGIPITICTRNRSGRY